MLDETFTAFILTVLNKKQSFIYETKARRIAMSWIGVCDAEQVQEDFPYSGNIDGKEIGIYLIDGEYYALEDVCPHAYALLSGALSKMARWNARCMRRYSTSKPASACMDPAVATLIVTRCGYTTIRSRLPLSRRTWHERIHGLQPGATGKPPVYATGGRRKRQYP